MTTAPVESLAPAPLHLPAISDDTPPEDRQTITREMCGVPAADDIYRDRISPTTPDALRAYVASLPVWDIRLDDDPVWMRPVTDYGFEPVEAGALATERALAAEGGFETQEPVEVDSALIRYASQDLVNIGIVDTYITRRDVLVDPDGWFGNDHVVIAAYKDGYAILDGTHRVTSDHLVGRPTLAYVVTA